MSNKLDDLAPTFKPLAILLLARLVEARIPCIIIDTLRTAEEQAAKVKAGLSWTNHSKHQDGLAIDICTYEEYKIRGPNKLDWDTTDPIWLIMGNIGQTIGLKWGVVSANGERKDLGHFEFVN